MSWRSAVRQDKLCPTHNVIARDIPPKNVKERYARRITLGVLQRFGHSVVESSLQVRHMVTNKLIQETDNPDPRIRLRALELLGKITDVGLFTERSEVTVTHQTSDDLRAKLKSKLQKMKDVTPAVEEAEIIGDDDA
jgi:hypothetical protein